MAHEKVYGICEDKCKEEVIPKGNFVVIDDIHVPADEGTASVDYPTGFDRTNTIVVGILSRYIKDIAEAIVTVHDAKLISVDLYGIDITLTNHDSLDRFVKLVLMKLD